MKMERCRFRKILSFVLLCLMLFSLPVPAQEEEETYVSPGPITKIDLGVTELNLSVGESYTFAVSYEPEGTVLTMLDWQVTDENVIRIDPMTDTVTALANGESRIFAESFDGFSYAVCTVTVSGGPEAKDASVMKSGDAYFGLSPEDLKKISADTLNRYLEFIAESSMDETAYRNVSERYFDLLGSVKPGTEQAQSQVAMECGMAESVPLSQLNAITLTGSLSAILKYAQNNPDLVEIFEFGPFYLEEPEVPEEDNDSVSKTVTPVTLEGAAQEITNIDFAHALGLTGKGRWIAVIDTGTDTTNAQFQGDRKIIEKCFSGSGGSGIYTYQSVCVTDDQRKGAAAAGNAWKTTEFDHGSHVAGIAVGTGGIAPQANLIAIQAFTEKVWTCRDNDDKKYYSCGRDANPDKCCKSTLRNAELGKAYDFLLDLSKTEKIQIDAVNMSYGGGREYTNACDHVNGYEKRYFDKMIEAGMVPVVAAGNTSYNNGLNDAACLSNAYSVGSLLNRADPVYRGTSNVGPMLSIAAPGSEIWSAGYTKPMMHMSGTSMAAPMVSGAIALVREMYPGMTVKDVEFYLKSISEKRVSQRLDYGFRYQKPVLTFGNILKLLVPYYDWISGGDHSITFKVDRMSRQVNFSAKVTDLNNNPVTGIKVQWKSDGNYTYVKVSGNALQNGTVYKVELTRTVKIGDKTYSSLTNEFGRPMGKAEKPSAVGGNGFVSLKGKAGTVRYNFYDAVTGKYVDSVNRPDGSQTSKITGFVNGKLYSVGMVPYETVSVNGENINFYGVESVRVPVMPMSEPFNAKVTYPAKDKSDKVTVSCTADTAADGIIVVYRKAGTNDKWTQGCTTKDNKFTCTIQNVGQGNEFRIQKYKAVKSKTYAGPAVIVKGSK